MTASLTHPTAATGGGMAALGFAGDGATSDWNGGPQPALLALARRGLVKGPILESGCGTGENALALAAWGKVVGVDSSAASILAARRKAQERGIPALFLQRDATQHLDLRYRFQTVIDAGLFHGLGGPDRMRYAQRLARLVEPGGHVHLMCSRLGNDPQVDNLSVRLTDVPLALGRQFRLTGLRPERFMQPSAIRDGWLATYTRMPKERRRRPTHTATPFIHG